MKLPDLRRLTKASVLELKLLARDPVTVIFTLALPVVVLYILGSVFGNRPEPSVYRGVGPMNYYVPAYIGLALASLGLIGVPAHLAGYRERGILKRFRASDVPIWSILGAQVAVTIVAGVAGSLILWGLSILSYHIDAPKAPLLVLAAFVLGALTFGAIGILLGALLPTARSAQGAGIILWFVMMMLGGPGPPLEVLSTTIRSIGESTPLHHVVVLLQDPWLGFGWNANETVIVLAWILASAMLAFLLLRYPLSLRRIRQHSARRTVLPAAGIMMILLVLSSCGSGAVPSGSPSATPSPSASTSPLSCTSSGAASASWPAAPSIASSPAPIRSAVVSGDTLTLTFLQGTPEFQVIPQANARFFVGDGQGTTVDMKGAAGAIIVLRGFRGDMVNYAGPNDLASTGPLLLEVRHVNEFEGFVHWAVGLSKPGCANVTPSGSALTFHFIPATS